MGCFVTSSMFIFLEQGRKWFCILERKLSNFFSREVGSPRARTRGKFKVAKKEGPTDVGMTGGWKAASYSIGIDSADFLAERLSSFRKRISGAEVVHKAGPREIGFVTDWTPASKRMNKLNSPICYVRLWYKRRRRKFFGRADNTSTKCFERCQSKEETWSQRQ